MYDICACNLALDLHLGEPPVAWGRYMGALATCLAPLDYIFARRVFFSLAASNRPRLGFENGWIAVGAELQNRSENCGLRPFRLLLEFPFRRIPSLQNPPWSQELSPPP